MDTAPATGRRRSEKRRFFWITEETSKQTGAKCSEQTTELSLQRCQLAAAQQPHGRALRGSETASSRTRRCCRSGRARQRPRGRGPGAGNPPPQHGLALPAPSPADSVSAASSLAARKCQTAAPTLESTRLLAVLLLPAVFPWEQAKGYKFRAGPAEVGSKEGRTGSGGCHSYRGGRPLPRFILLSTLTLCFFWNQETRTRKCWHFGPLKYNQSL